MRILEIGGGEGGAHLKPLPYRRSYYVADSDISELVKLKRNYPWVNIIPGFINFRRIRNEYFDQIEMRFPFNTLLVPGLQQKARDINNLGSALTDSCPDDFTSPQWYGEFARILKPAKKLIIWGDEFVDVDAIKQLSEPHFQFGSSVPLNVRQLRRMGTHMSLHWEEVIKECVSEGLVVEPPKKIILVKR